MYILPVIIFCCGILLGALFGIWQTVSVFTLFVYAGVGGFLGSALGGAAFIYLYMTQQPGDAPDEFLRETESSSNQKQLSAPGNAPSNRLPAPDNISAAPRSKSHPTGSPAGGAEPPADALPATPKAPPLRFPRFRDKRDRKKIKRIKTLEKKIALMKKNEKGN